MASLLFGSEFEVEKVLIWKTEIPFENQVQQSPNFSLMGLEWCVRFSFEDTAPDLKWFDNSKCTYVAHPNIFHVITLHRVINGQVETATKASGQELLNQTFSVKTFLREPTTNGKEETREMNTLVERKIQRVWYAGQNDDIFKSLPCLYKCCKVKIEVVFQFYDQPVSTFRLSIGTDEQKLQNQMGFIDKSIHVSPEVPQNLQSLSSEFCHLLEKEILTDVKVECGGHTFQAHRSVLAARSKVFHAMFHSKMTESETGAITISDMDARVLKMLLKFIYSGKTDDLTEENSADLYEAADKYGIISLRQACAYWITRNLTVKNCLKYLKIADSHSDCVLKDAVISFIINNPSLLKSAEWLALSKNSLLLGNEVLQTYIALTVL